MLLANGLTGIELGRASLAAPPRAKGLAAVGLSAAWPGVLLSSTGGVAVLTGVEAVERKLIRLSAFFSWGAGASQLPGVGRQTYQLMELLQPGLALKPWLLPTPRRQLSEASL